MKNLLSTSCTEVLNTETSLQLLVNRLVSNSLAGIARNKCVVVNEVAAEFNTAADKKVVPVIRELLTTMVSNACNGHIHISAEKFKGITILEMQERNNYNGYALAFSLKSIEPHAAMIGGNIAIKDAQKLVTTVFFSFPN